MLLHVYRSSAVDTAVRPGFSCFIDSIAVCMYRLDLERDCGRVTRINACIKRGEMKGMFTERLTSRRVSSVCASTHGFVLQGKEKRIPACKGYSLRAFISRHYYSCFRSRRSIIVEISTQTRKLIIIYLKITTRRYREIMLQKVYKKRSISERDDFINALF